MDNIKAQLQSLAKAHEDGIDTEASAIQDLYMVIDHLTTQVRQADCCIAAMRHVLVSKGVVNSDEIDSMQSKIAEVFNKKLEETKSKSDGPLLSGVEREMALIHQAAKEAAETPYDPQAFIFGS